MHFLIKAVQRFSFHNFQEPVNEASPQARLQSFASVSGKVESEAEATPEPVKA